MRAMQVKAFDTPLELVDLPRPMPGPGEVLLRVHACGVNFADTLLVQGRYQERLEPPFTPGLELCGTIEALGVAKAKNAAMIVPTYLERYKPRGQFAHYKN